MSCTIPLFDKLLHKLGYEPACILHDIDYKEWYSKPIGTLAALNSVKNPLHGD